jgi:MiaB/RimO family radical SAM methylthiotransferase
MDAQEESRKSKFQEYFKINGYEIVTGPEKADYILISTCAFKKEEEEYSLERIQALSRHNAKLVVYGCLPEIAPTRFNALPPVDWVSPKNIEEFDAYFKSIKIRISELRDCNLIPANITYTPMSNAVVKFVNDFQISREFLSRSVSYVKNKIVGSVLSEQKYYLVISKGCLGKCSYCAIKRAVGPLRSKPVDVILEEYNRGEDAGYRNFIILGDDVGAYGVDFNSDFPCILSTLLAKAAPQASFHVEEIHPKWMVLYRDRLLKLIATGKIKSILCPVQSGNNRILKLMNREHAAEAISEVLMAIRAVHPGISITTQIIAGFPSETEDEFDDTLRFLSENRFDTVTVFPYDEKENIPSAAIQPKINDVAIRQRVTRARKYLAQHAVEALLSCPK